MVEIDEESLVITVEPGSRYGEKEKYVLSIGYENPGRKRLRKALNEQEEIVEIIRELNGSRNYLLGEVCDEELKKSIEEIINNL